MSTIANMKPAEAAGMPVPGSGRCPALKQAALFVQGRKLWVALASIAVLVPCFWHARIAAGDLSSHVYNVWLAQLIRAGKAPGLYLEPRTNNILFDVMVDWSSRLLGFAVAEKVCVALAVLVFFWGAFAFVSAAARRAPWFLIPVLAMLAYGRVFELGFMNFYLSLGLAFFALALVWRGARLDFAALVPLAVLMWIAHPLGVALFASVGGYLALTRWLRPKAQLVLVCVSMLAAVVVSKYLGSHYQTENLRVPFYITNGTDQLRLFNDFYYQLAAGLALVAAAFLVIAAIKQRRDPEFMAAVWIPLQLYVVLWFALFLMPNTIMLPAYNGAPVALLVTRMTLALAVVGCCVLATIQARVWHVGIFATIAVLFFASLYFDTARMNDYEAQAEKLVSGIPAGQRVMAAQIPLPPGDWPLWHVIDRVCIGHCFVYSNYEPASGQFRVRALPGNGIAVSSNDDVREMQLGEYVVRPQDLPLYEIGPCRESRLKLCGHYLNAGEVAGSIKTK